VTSAWQVYTSAHQHAFREAVEHSSQTAPAHRWAEAQGSYPALILALRREWTTDGGSSLTRRTAPRTCCSGKR